MADSFYKILDKNGIEIPDHYTGRRRTYEEAKKMVDGLNKNGEHSPYTMIEINGNVAQQIKITQTSNADMNIGVYKTLTAVEWLVEQYANENYSIEVYEQAKQMEKEQIMKAVDRGYDEGCKFPEDMTLKNSEQYYNETYNK